MSSEAPPSGDRGELWSLGLAALLVVVADQVTKALVVGALAVGEQARVIGDLVVIWRVQNVGASFNLFQFDGSQVLFFFVTILALGLISWFHRSFRGHGRWLQVLLGLVLGGTLGNFVDRLRFGYVTDFVSVGFGSTRFPTFNVADSALTIGMGALIVILLFRDPLHEREPAA